MDDNTIINLYFQRSETAIRESDKKYGAYCSTIANNILHSPQDSEECVNDTWVRAWNTIPPEKPVRLSVFFGKITRNLAIDRWRKAKSEKSGGGQIALCLDELAECVGTKQNFGDELDLKEAIDAFLSSLKPQPKRIFMLRYWHMCPISDVARLCGISEGAVKMSLKRTRNLLREYLEQEGIYI
ncbi:MAG: RNA polymerase sigma factor [Ruminococcus sp.]|nr:RNA polymerase sigma factor [Ruminococcus sp.]